MEYQKMKLTIVKHIVMGNPISDDKILLIQIKWHKQVWRRKTQNNRVAQTYKEQIYFNW